MATKKKTAKKNSKVKALPSLDFSKPQRIEVPSLDLHRVQVVVKGTSDLVTHNWNEKAKNQMRAAQQHRAKLKKEAKVPEELFEASKYKNEAGEDCVKAAFFKAAMVAAGRFVDGINMTQLRMSLFVVGDLLPLEFESCEMREDMVRLASGVADMRYRPGYKGWKARLTIEFPPTEISLSQVLLLVRMAGQRVGICEGRPEKSKTLQWGRFDIDMSELGSEVTSYPVGHVESEVA